MEYAFCGFFLGVFCELKYKYLVVNYISKNIEIYYYDCFTLNMFEFSETFFHKIIPIDLVGADYVPSLFIFKRKAAVLEKLKKQDSDKIKMGRYERNLRRNSVVSEKKAMLNL